MKTKDLAVVGFILVLAALLLFLWLSPSGHPMAPAARFKDLNGKEFTLEQLKGHPVIINFWATTCPGCVKEIPLLINLADKYASSQLIIIGVAMDYDPPGQVREMARRKKMNYTIVLDSTGVLAKTFNNVTLTPTTFFINRQGQIVKNKLGELSHNEIEEAVNNIIL